ncbi:hypothetical protein AS026_15825 [Rhizobium altiplani]|uniref:Uncharacterized protein n=1 Tax=Rhizobium altiplani TaxID=1864509 RepID=A0A109JB82_9HYPH|nr:hypothetical protein [Rhizobium altiplani]KWV45673.1 hypothetical protein AS026_15825 [Rhizobium altiplani]
MHVDPFSESVGSVVPDGASICVYEDEFKSVYWVRRGDLVDVLTFTKVDALLAANRAEANDFSKTSKLGNMVKIASVPTALHYQMQAEGITQDDKAIARFLNDSDNAKFRTNSLRV